MYLWYVAGRGIAGRVRSGDKPARLLEDDYPAGDVPLPAAPLQPYIDGAHGGVGQSQGSTAFKAVSISCSSPCE